MCLRLQRPDLHAPIIDFAILRPELVSPGYIFLAPYRNVDPGPYIYDNWGNLIWSGAGSSGPKTAHAPRVCQYKGADHICYFQGEQHQGFARGHGVIMDQNYRIVKTVESSGAGASSDMHEFKMTPYANGTTMLMTVYQPRQYDLTIDPRFNVEHGMGWVVEGVFQEVEIDTGRVVFEWRSLDHVDPGQSWTMPGTTDTSGDGLHEQSPWDYFHLNSIDKDENGDYLLSARHTSGIYKVSGIDGTIHWQLGGSASSFEQTNFEFSYQHHARWVSQNSTHTILSFYDNASNTYNQTNDFSHGWIIAIDHIAETATMIQEWGAPEDEGGLLSGSQGNMQLLPNGGCHIGWGEHAYFSEHTAEGSAVMYAKVADRASNVMIYRSGKYNWTAQPLTKPALWTYSLEGAKMASWVSWNGATEVRSWNFYTADNATGPFIFVGNARKTGFETEFHSTRFSMWSYAEAVGDDNLPLERSVIAKTFVPSTNLVPYCNDRGCEYSTAVPEESSTPYETTIDVDEEYLSSNRGFNTSHYYADLPANKSASLKEAPPTLSSSSGSNFGVLTIAVGLLLAFGITVFGFFLYTKGQLEPVGEAIYQRTTGLRNAVTKSLFGSRVLGKYQRVKDKELDGFESSSGSSSAA